MRFATLAYTKPDAKYDVMEFEAPVFLERIITTIRRKNKISFSLMSNSQSSGLRPISSPYNELDRIKYHIMVNRQGRTLKGFATMNSKYQIKLTT